jgi:hypothetical protein
MTVSHVRTRRLSATATFLRQGVIDLGAPSNGGMLAFRHKRGGVFLRRAILIGALTFLAVVDFLTGCGDTES